MTAKDSAILYLPVTQDRSGEPRLPIDVMRNLNAVSPVPIFIHHDSFQGAVGGYVIKRDPYRQALVEIILEHGVLKSVPKSMRRLKRII